MPITTEVFKRYITDVFVETGSYLGDGIEAAIQAGFKTIYSIELSDKYYDICVERFKKNTNVKIIKGDSGYILYDVIKNINSTITFWLDGHHSCGDTALGSAWSPLLLELDMISRHPVKNHNILIDDMRCWSVDNPVIGFGEDQIRERILKINSSYEFKYEAGVCENDILASKVHK